MYNNASGTLAEQRLTRFLYVISVFFALLAVIVMLGAYIGPSTLFFTTPPWVSNTFAGCGTLALLAWISAHDVRRYRPMLITLALSLVWAIGAFAIVQFTPHGPAQSQWLWLATGICLIFSIITALLTNRAKNSLRYWSPFMPSLQQTPLTSWEKVARIVAVVFGAGSCIAGVANLALAFPSFSPPETIAFMRQPIFVAGSAVKLMALGICALFAAKDLRRYAEMFTLFILGNGISLLCVIVSLVGINAFGAQTGLTLFGFNLNTFYIMLVAAGIDIIAVGSFIVLKTQMSRQWLANLKFFNAVEFRALEAIAETLIYGDGNKKTELVAPHEIVFKTDGYLSSFQSNRLILARLAAWGLDAMPLLSFMPPLSYLSDMNRKEFIDKHFKRDSDLNQPQGIYKLLRNVNFRDVINFDIFDLADALVRFNMQLTYVGYYSQEKVQQQIGYTPFSKRPTSKNKTAHRPHKPLQVETPATLTRRGQSEVHDADVVIIGSGAAGGILAEQMLEKGRKVLMLERGPYVRPDDMSEDEPDMIGKLYGDGALQISQALRFTFLQGRCVGGTTVVNNAVCFDTPDSVLDRWNNEYNAGIDIARYKQSQAFVKTRMKIQPQRQNLNPGDMVLQRGLDALADPTRYEYDVISANIQDCLGCGYCNIGCRYGRKLSVLDEVLPKSQQSYGAEQFQIWSEAQALYLSTQNNKVNDILVQVGKSQRLHIRQPKTVIISVGAVASSWLLMQSDIGTCGATVSRLPVGEGVCFNMGSPLHAYFPSETLNSFAGLQIAHYLKFRGHPGFVAESWYNPPVAQAQTMPGWLDTHYTNMLNYNKMAAVGILVGTESRGRVKSALLFPNSPDLEFPPKDYGGKKQFRRDLFVLADALKQLGEVMFMAGAKEVYLSTRQYRSYSNATGSVEKSVNKAKFTTGSELKDIHTVVHDDREILLGTGHPQGGNALSQGRDADGRHTGVIGPDFKVYGYDNLHVCDASIFPSATTVNPQQTVMTLAHYAAQDIS